LAEERNKCIIKDMWEKIKKILQKEGGKCIIVEDNQPTYLVMKLEDYQKTVQSNDETEKANRDIDQWKAIEEEKEEPGLVEAEKEEVKVEDLPF
jgi:hypothetical protein